MRHVAIVGSGGLSHQVSGERAGFNNTEWDMEFLELLEKNPEKLTELSIADYAKRGGIEGAEVIMWLIMRGALTKKVRKVHQSYAIPTMTATGTVIYEEVPDAGEAQEIVEYADQARREYDGVTRTFGIQEGHYFFWYGNYYAAQVFFLAGDDDPELWNWYWTRIKRDLLAMQETDGSWPNRTGPGSAFSTAIACIILQIPNQYLPIFHR